MPQISIFYLKLIIFAAETISGNMAHGQTKLNNKQTSGIQITQRNKKKSNTTSKLPLSHCTCLTRTASLQVEEIFNTENDKKGRSK